MWDEGGRILACVIVLGGLVIVCAANIKIFKPHKTEHPVWKAVFMTCLVSTLLLSPISVWLCSPPTVWQAAAGISVYVSGTALFLWAAAQIYGRQRLTIVFSSDKPAHLVTSGPFAYIRHPFYCAYFLSFVGVCLLTRTKVMLALTSVMTVGYFKAAFLEESKMRTSSLSLQYDQYKHQAGLFWPKLW